jgi:hypothetical protein
VSSIFYLSACDDSSMTAPSEQESAQVPESSKAGQYDALFEQAAEEFSVPASLLKAIAATETQFHMVEGKEEFKGRPAAYGLMALRGERLDRGAKLADVSLKEARTEPLANIRAAAALLREEGQKKGVEGAEALDAWAGAVAQFSGIDNEEAQAGYVHRGVYDVLNEGLVAEKNGNVVATIEPVKTEADFPKPKGQPQERLQGEAQKNGAKTQSYDYGPAIWRGPSPNQSGRVGGSAGDVNMIVIHTCEGNYSGCWSWLNDSRSGASAHYVVSRYGSEITQLVREYRGSWHIAADYNCNKNNGVDCYKNGYNSRQFSVGIEHAGYVSQNYPAGQVDASAKMSCNISQDQGVPRDRNHIWGHERMQPWNRNDPGPNWPWATYMNKVRSYCGDGGGGNGRIIVDSNDNNNGSNADHVPPQSWSTGSYGDYYGTGYYYHFAEASSDAVTFRFYLEEAERKTVYAWWTQGSNRTSAAPYIAYNSNGQKLGTIYENQQANGGQWNGVGTWNFTAGWNEIRVSHWTGAEGAVIADAVMVE